MRQGQAARAYPEVFEALREKVVPDAITYNAVIYACGKGKQPELAGKCSRR